MKKLCLSMLVVAGLSGVLLTACGSGTNTGTDSTGAMQADTSMNMTDTSTSTMQDTASAMPADTAGRTQP